MSLTPPPIPPALSSLRRLSSLSQQPRMRLPRGTVALQAQLIVAIAGLVCASLAAIPFVDDFDAASNSVRFAFIVALAATVVGAVMTPLRFIVGPPLVVGGVALFVANAVTLGFARIDTSTAFDSTDAKIMLGAGVAGLVALVVATPLLIGRGLSSVVGLICLAAIAMVVATAFLVRIDDTRTWPQAGSIVAALFVAIVIMIGAGTGRFGSIAALVASVVQLPGWIDLASDTRERRWLAVGGLVADIVIVVVAAVTLVLAATGSADRAFGIGPSHAVVSPIVQPMVSPVAVPIGQPRRGAVLNPVSVTMPGAVVAPAVPRAVPAGVGAVGSSHPEVAAAWAADPYGRHELRYWDGDTWTGHVSDRGVVAVDLPG